MNASVATGIDEAMKAESIRKRHLDERTTLSQKRAKVFGLDLESDSGSDDDSDSEVSALPGTLD